jgi:nicotinate phosphoribosyltransferase
MTKKTSDWPELPQPQREPAESGADQSVAIKQPPHRTSPALLTDLYELTMLRAYFELGMEDEAVFSLFVRRLPEHRNYLVAAGLDDVLHFLETLAFDPAAISYLEQLGLFSPRFLRHLEALRFTGDVYAVPEGTVVFGNEPLLEVVAPMPQAQLVETAVMNQIVLQTVLASKAARVVAAAQGRTVVDFGMRRMHGFEATLKAARAFYIAGVDSTSNVAAGQLYGIPVAGTMAHSYIQAHDDELAAFRNFARIYPETVLLVDTYDTLSGVRKVVQLARELGPDFKVRGVRLDSGDLGELARESRRILDAAGLQSVGIFASGGLNEDVIRDLLEKGAPITGFGVGTDLGVSRDAPSLDIAYKLVAYGGHDRMKLSPEKLILPGRKQVWRVEEDGAAVRDVIARSGENLAGRPLLVPVMKAGRRLPGSWTDLAASRNRAREEIARLPARVRALDPATPPYPVTLSRELEVTRDRLRAQLARASESQSL